MKIDEKIHCPRCSSGHTDLISYMYHYLESENAGHRLFVDGIETELQKKRNFSKEKRTLFLEKFHPPVESKLSLPSLTVALMAFFLSWLVVGAFLMSKIGGQTYLIVTTLIIVLIAYPFYSTMLLVISQVRRNYVRYRSAKEAWIKKHYCYDCEYVFTIDSDLKDETLSRRL